MTRTDGHRDMFGARNEAQQIATKTGHTAYYWQRMDGRWEAGLQLSDPNGKAVQPRYSEGTTTWGSLA